MPLCLEQTGRRFRKGVNRLSKDKLKKKEDG